MAGPQTSQCDVLRESQSLLHSPRPSPRCPAGSGEARGEARRGGEEGSGAERGGRRLLRWLGSIHGELATVHKGSFLDGDRTEAKFTRATFSERFKLERLRITKDNNSVW